MTAQVDSPARPGIRYGTALVSALLVAALAIGGLAVYGVGRVLGAIPTPSEVAAVFAAKPYLEVGPVVVESVQDLANLTTVEMVEYTIVEKGTDAGWLEWARGDSVRMFAVAHIGAGIDLAGLTESNFNVSEDGAVVVTVPHAEVQYVDVDSDATMVLDRETGLFTKGDPQLETEARQIAETTLVEGSVEHGILQEAESNATTVLTSFLQSLGYTEVTVRFVG